MMRHPPFVGSVERTGGDYLTRESAERLAAIIRAAWKRAGHDVEVVVERVGHAGAREPMFAPRMPGLVRGLPVR